MEIFVACCSLLDVVAAFDVICRTTDDWLYCYYFNTPFIEFYNNNGVVMLTKLLFSLILFLCFVAFWTTQLDPTRQTRLTVLVMARQMNIIYWVHCLLSRVDIGWIDGWMDKICIVFKNIDHSWEIITKYWKYFSTVSQLIVLLLKLNLLLVILLYFSLSMSTPYRNTYSSVHILI